MCQCKSYNMDGDGSGDVILALPDWVNPEKKVRTACVDPCIVHVILRLWSKGVNTLGCCCSHNRGKPNIVIDGSHENIGEIKDWVREVDDRDWDILQWHGKELRCM